MNVKQLVEREPKENEIIKHAKPELQENKLLNNNDFLTISSIFTRLSFFASSFSGFGFFTRMVIALFITLFISTIIWLEGE